MPQNSQLSCKAPKENYKKAGLNTLLKIILRFAL